jgi:hypothetical protein
MGNRCANPGCGQQQSHCQCQWQCKQVKPPRQPRPKCYKVKVN